MLFAVYLPEFSMYVLDKIIYIDGKKIDRTISLFLLQRPHKLAFIFIAKVEQGFHDWQ